MRGYIELNTKAQSKILKKFKKLTKFCHEKINVEKKALDYITNSPLNNAIKTLAEISADVEKLFYNNYFDKYTFRTIKELKEYVKPVYITQTQSFYLGFYVALLLVSICLCYLIASHFHIDMDDDVEFKGIFAMFRAYLIICLYMWLLGLNVYAWNVSHINYKLALNFTNHHSYVISIFKRAAVFSSIGMLMVLVYLILRTEIQIIYQMVQFISIDTTPIICWTIFFIYMIFPIKGFFNSEGRFWTFRVFAEACTPFIFSVKFQHSFLMDQLTSLVGPMRDMEYTLCYFVYYDSPFDERMRLCSMNRGIVLFIGIFPHAMRMMQTLRQVYDGKRYEYFNALKYLMAILVAIFSFLESDYPIFDNIWWITAIISSLYSSYWDIIFDFGFFEPGKNYPLRQKLAYRNKSFYYFVLVTNIFLRFIWILSLSPEVVFSFIRPEFFSLMIFSMEVIRRGIWNFIRMEYEHIKKCKEFRVTADLELPFKRTQDGSYILRESHAIDMIMLNKRLEKIKDMTRPVRKGMDYF